MIRMSTCGIPLGRAITQPDSDAALLAIQMLERGYSVAVRGDYNTAKFLLLFRPALPKPIIELFIGESPVTDHLTEIYGTPPWVTEFLTHYHHLKQASCPTP